MYCLPILTSGVVGRTPADLNSTWYLVCRTWYVASVLHACCRHTEKWYGDLDCWLNVFGLYLREARTRSFFLWKFPITIKKYVYVHAAGPFWKQYAPGHCCNPVHWLNLSGCSDSDTPPPPTHTPKQFVFRLCLARLDIFSTLENVRSFLPCMCVETGLMSLDVFFRLPLYSCRSD